MHPSPVDLDLVQVRLSRLRVQGLRTWFRFWRVGRGFQIIKIRVEDCVSGAPRNPSLLSRRIQSGRRKLSSDVSGFLGPKRPA